jgi:hypothetical protein
MKFGQRKFFVQRPEGSSARSRENVYILAGKEKRVDDYIQYPSPLELSSHPPRNSFT